MLAQSASARGRFGVRLSSAHLGSLIPLRVTPGGSFRAQYSPGKWKGTGNLKAPSPGNPWGSPDPGWGRPFLKLHGGGPQGTGAQICGPLGGGTRGPVLQLRE